VRVINRFLKFDFKFCAHGPKSR